MGFHARHQLRRMVHTLLQDLRVSDALTVDAENVTMSKERAQKRQKLGEPAIVVWIGTEPIDGRTKSPRGSSDVGPSLSRKPVLDVFVLCEDLDIVETITPAVEAKIAKNLSMPGGGSRLASTELREAEDGRKTQWIALLRYEITYQSCEYTADRSNPSFDFE